jgi:hypothetical protein
MILRPQPGALEALPLINIAHISSTAFYMQARRLGNTPFTTSLYEINRIVEEREDLDDDVTLKEIRSKVPVQSQTYIDVFSKAASDRLPPYWSYDHRIQLKSENTLSYSPL